MKKMLVQICIALLLAGNAIAQETAPAMYAVYEDIVKPSMNVAYRDAVKKLKTACEANKLDFRWTTVAYDDNSYTHLVPIKAFADLDKNPFAVLEAKLGKEAHANLWADIDKCVLSHDSRVVLRMDNLSYLTPPAGEDFRDILFWFPEAGKEAEAEPLIKEWVNLFNAKKGPNGIVTYRVIFGGDTGYAFVSWGKNLADVAAKSQKSGELHGEEGNKLWAKTLSITKTRYSKRGWIVNDLSYGPPVVAAK